MQNHLRMALTVALLIFLGGQSWAVSDEETALIGLKKVQLQISPIEEEVEQAGLTTSTLLTDFQSKLMKAGITVVASEQALPVLLLNITVFKYMTGPLYLYQIQVELHEPVHIVRSNALIHPSTYTKPGYFGIGTLISVREKALDEMDLFIKTWLAANPKSEK